MSSRGLSPSNPGTIASLSNDDSLALFLSAFARSSILLCVAKDFSSYYIHFFKCKFSIVILCDLCDRYFVLSDILAWVRINSLVSMSPVHYDFSYWSIPSYFWPSVFLCPYDIAHPPFAFTSFRGIVSPCTELRRLLKLHNQTFTPIWAKNISCFCAFTVHIVNVNRYPNL